MNTARNGSAMYMAGNTANVRIYQDTIDLLDKNQAWVYDLPINFNSTTKNITSVLYGGNKILNAFYNSKSNDAVFLPEGTGWTHPVNGAELSENGTKYYQNGREPYQNVNINV